MTEREQSEGREAMLARVAASVERMIDLGQADPMVKCRPDFEGRAELEEWASQRGVTLVLSKHVRPGLVFVVRNPGLTLP